jgi:hypothetical protein
MCIICTEEYHGKTVISCWNCPLLREIPVIPGLQKLWCNSCPLLTEIPVIPGLQILACWYCPLLTKIPDIPGLQKLECWNCPWVKPSQEKLALLVFLQRKIRKIIEKKRKVIDCPSYLLSTLEKY